MPINPHTPPRQIRRPGEEAEQEPENWDDDFEEDGSPKKDRNANKRARDGNWESSDEELEGLGLGFSDQGQEDRTVTARSRRGLLTKSSPSPVPPLPTHLHQQSSSTNLDPFPTSPATSILFVPHSGRDSVAYSFASSTPLRPGAAALASQPSPPDEYSFLVTSTIFLGRQLYPSIKSRRREVVSSRASTC